MVNTGRLLENLLKQQMSGFKGTEQWETNKHLKKWWGESGFLFVAIAGGSEPAGPYSIPVGFYDPHLT